MTKLFAWHPDGQRVSFWGRRRYKPTEEDFWTAPLPDGKPVKSELAPEVLKQITAASISLHDFVWAPSGRALYFEGTTKDVRNIWKVTVDPKTLRWVAGPERLTTGPGRDTHIALGASGEKLAFTTRTESTRIWSLPFDASRGRITGAGQPITAAGMDAAYPDLTRDGKKLAFAALHAGREELWEKSLEDGRETLLTADEYSRHVPRWSRDGTRLAYRRCTLETNPTCSIVMLPAGGGSEERLNSPVPHDDEIPLDWGAAGKWIVGSSRRLTPERVLISLLPLSGAPHAETEARVVASHPDYDLWGARFSPDDRWICLNAVRATGLTSSVVYVVPTSGGEWVRITEENEWADKPHWSPDGKVVYFVSSRGAFFNVWGRRFDPGKGQPVGKPFRVTAFESPGRMVTDHIGRLDIPLSENRLVVPIMEATGNIWMLENAER